MMSGRLKKAGFCISSWALPKKLMETCTCSESLYPGTALCLPGAAVMPQSLLKEPSPSKATEALVAVPPFLCLFH